MPENRFKESLAKQGFWYLFAGAAAALLELILFQSLYFFNLADIKWSNIIAVVTSTALNFAINGNVTFKGSKNQLWSGLKYLALFFFNMAFSTLTIDFLVTCGWHSLWAKLLTMICIVLWNFVLYRKVVFR